MNQKYDFTEVVSRLGTGAEKYEARASLFGKADVEPFWVADMDFCTPAFVTEALQARMSHSMFGYTTVSQSLFDAIRWWQGEQHGAPVEKEWIRLSPSVVTSIATAILGLTAPGDGVVVFSPVYGPFFFVTRHNGRKVLDQPLKLVDGQYAMDFDALRNGFETERPALVLLCNPHNPGGRVWTQNELQQLVSLCREFGVRIFSDEIHCDIVYEPHKHTSLLTIPEALTCAVVAHSIGKTFNTSGLNASFVVIADAKMRRTFADAQEQSHCGSVNLLGKIALEAALSAEGAAYKKQLVAALRQNINAATERLQTIPGGFVMDPQATFLVWCDFRSLGKWPTVMKTLVRKANVALSGGTFFGPAGEGWFRLNCAHPQSRLLPAVDRMVEVLSRQ